MSCKHGNHESACDICDEVSAAYESGLTARLAAPAVANAALTDEQIDAIMASVMPRTKPTSCFRKLARAIEAAAATNAALVEALREITNDYAEWFDLESPSTNPGIKSCIKQARAALAAAGVKP